MLEANKKRIAWYLGLQRLLHFPKSFLAPVAASRLRGRRNISDLDMAVEGVRSGRDLTDISRRLTNFTAVSFPRFGASSLLANDIGSPTAFGKPKMSRPDQRTSPSRRKMFQEISGPRLAAIVQQPTETISSANRELPTSRRLGRLFDHVHHTPVDTRDSLPLAPMHAASSPPDVVTAGSAQILTPISGETTDMRREQDAVLKNDKPWLKSQSGKQYQQLVQDRVTPPTTWQAEQNRPGMSTIHIDGAVLGRWAIQYLERALGKPGTGMTGVDPRATIPRSRIAPF